MPLLVFLLVGYCVLAVLARLYFGPRGSWTIAGFALLLALIPTVNGLAQRVTARDYWLVAGGVVLLAGLPVLAVATTLSLLRGRNLELRRMAVITGLVALGALLAAFAVVVVSTWVTGRQ